MAVSPASALRRCAGALRVGHAARLVARRWCVPSCGGARAGHRHHARFFRAAGHAPRSVPSARRHAGAGNLRLGRVLRSGGGDRGSASAARVHAAPAAGKRAPGRAPFRSRTHRGGGRWFGARVFAYDLRARRDGNDGRPDVGAASGRRLGGICALARPRARGRSVRFGRAGGILGRRRLGGRTAPLAAPSRAFDLGAPQRCALAAHGTALFRGGVGRIGAGRRGRVLDDPHARRVAFGNAAAWRTQSRTAFAGSCRARRRGRCHRLFARGHRRGRAGCAVDPPGGVAGPDGCRELALRCLVAARAGCRTHALGVSAGGIDFVHAGRHGIGPYCKSPRPGPCCRCFRASRYLSRLACAGWRSATLDPPSDFPDAPPRPRSRSRPNSPCGLSRHAGNGRPVPPGKSPGTATRLGSRAL